MLTSRVLGSGLLFPFIYLFNKNKNKYKQKIGAAKKPKVPKELVD